MSTRDGDQKKNTIGMSARPDWTIYQVLRAWAEQTPQATALLSTDHEPVTYGQLIDHVDSFVQTLSQIGIGPEDRVAIALPNSLEAAIAILGVSCAAAAVPLNPTEHQNAFDFYLSSTRTKALVVHLKAAPAAVLAARTRGIPIIEVPSTDEPKLSGFVPKVSTPVLSGPYREPTDVAIVLHTSGTTSNPKRVPLTHRNLCASAFSIRKTLNLTTSDRCLGVMPLFHIHGLVGGLLASLAAGASFAVTPQFDGDRFLDWMKELSPTWYTAVPAIHQEILKCARQRNETISTPRLRFIRSSSASLPHKVMLELEKSFNVPVIEAYGMTEASHQICSNLLPPADRKPGSVGMAIHTDIVIVDRTGNALESGKIGEIVIRGTNVMKGYEPDGINEDSFIHGRLRTGDLGYFDSEGNLFLAGRLKEIINRGGNKISPCEIDAALLEHPDVLQAAAFGTPHPTLGEDLAAAVVPSDPIRITQESIREHLSHRLALSKLPSQLFIVDYIPRSSTGKVQRAHLAKIFRDPLSRDFVAPKNKLEARLARIFTDVLNIDRISVLDNFFALGGDSLRATQVLSRVRSQFSVSLPISTLFLKPTAAELAEEIAASIAPDGTYQPAMIRKARTIS